MLSLGYKGTLANYMTAPIYAAALVASVLVGFSSDHFGEKPFHVLGATVFAGVSFILAATIPNDGAKYAFIVFGGMGIWSAVPLSLSYCLANYKNNETRAVAIAIINVGPVPTSSLRQIFAGLTPPSFPLSTERDLETPRVSMGHTSGPPTLHRSVSLRIRTFLSDVADLARRPHFPFPSPTPQTCLGSRARLRLLSLEECAWSSTDCLSATSRSGRRSRTTRTRPRETPTSATSRRPTTSSSRALGHLFDSCLYQCII